MNKLVLCVPVILIAFIFSCSRADKKQVTTVSPEIIIDSARSSCSFLTKDDKGKLVLGWTRQLDTATYIFCYAISPDGGKTFGKAIEIPGSTNVHPHGENMPKLVFKPTGEIIAAWGAANPNPHNKYSGLVYYSQSFNDGKTWTRPVCITSDTASFDQRYFDLALLPGGEAGIVWLDNRKRDNKEGSGLYYAVTVARSGFQGERLISGPCCQCCRTDLFVDSRKNIHVLYRAIINDSIRDMVHMVSGDEGRNFTEPRTISQDNWVINGCPHTGPAMTENSEGLQFTWFTGGDHSGIYYNCSKDNGINFTFRDNVSGRASKHCQIAALENDDLLIVWEESFPNGTGFSSRIVVERRDSWGKTRNKEYITQENSHASFPSIQVVDSHDVVVAYTDTENSREQVRYKILRIE